MPFASPHLISASPKLKVKLIKKYFFKLNFFILPLLSLLLLVLYSPPNPRALFCCRKGDPCALQFLAQVLGSNLLQSWVETLNFCDQKKKITSHAILASIVPVVFRRWIMLVNSDKTAFVLPPRSSEKLSFNPLLKGRDWEAAALSLRLLALSSPKWRLHVWLCRLLICRQYVKVAHVSDFHGHPS